jgi:hypothetical protein
MAFDAKPSTWLGSGYSVASNAAVFNTSSHGTPCLTQLTDAQANATTGDIRIVARALLFKLAAAWDATAVANRPGKMRIRKTSGLNSVTGTVTETYNIEFDVAITTLGTVTTE